MSAPFVPEERRVVVERLTSVISRPAGRALVTGEPGVGKTTMVDAALEEAAQLQSIQVLYAHAGHAHRLPYLALHDLFADIDFEGTSLLPKHRAALELALGRGDDRTPLTTSAVFLAVDALVRELLQGGQLVIVIDHLDGIDPESYDLMCYLSSRRYLGGGPTFIATQTTAFSLTKEQGIDSSCFLPEHVVHVRPLQRASLKEVLLARLPAREKEYELSEVWEKTGGNPLWALELITQRSDERALIVPTSLRGLVQERVRTAAESSVNVLAIASLLGSVTGADLTRMLELTPGSIATAIDEQLVLDVNGRIVPAHPLLGGAAITMLSDKEIKRLHARIADVLLEPAQRAHHLDRSVEPGSNALVATALRNAAAWARGVGALGSTEDLLKRAIARTPMTEDSAPDALLELADVQVAQDQHGASLRTLSALDIPALALGRLDRTLPLLVTSMTAVMGRSAARVAVDDLRVAAASDHNRVAMLDAYRASLAVTSEERVERALAALRVLRGTGLSPIASRCAVTSLLEAEADQSGKLAGHLLAELGDLETTSPGGVLDNASVVRGVLGYQIGLLSESRHLLEAARARAGNAGESTAANALVLHLAVLELHAGNRDNADQLIRAWEDSEYRPTALPLLAMTALGVRLLQDADSEGLRSLLARSVDEGTAPRALLIRSALSGLEAARHERWDVAVPLLSAARDAAESAGVHEPGRRLWLDFSLARSLIGSGQPAAAAEVIDQLEALSAGSRPLLDGVVLRLRGLSAADKADWGAAEAMLLASVHALALQPYPVEHALSLLELGRFLRLRRSREQASEALTSAAAVAERSGDAQLLALIEEDRAGADGSISFGLSVRENAVAAAAASGRTNREIALANFISVRTVETQLSSVYRKIGVRSRSELAALLLHGGENRAGARSESAPPAHHLS